MRFLTPKNWLIFFLLSLTLAVAITSCDINFRNDRRTELPEGIPKEFEALFETYSVIQKDSLNKGSVNDQALVEGAIRGMLETLDDPYASYISPDIFRIEGTRFDGTFEGIGAEVNINDEGEILIVAPIPGTPAESAGILPGDRILEVNGESTEGMGLFEVVTKIRGPKGSTVDLLVLHNGQEEPASITITRGEIDVPSVVSRMMEGDVGYLRISSFGSRTNEEVKKAVEDFKRRNAQGIVIDLRNNPGGLVTSVTETTDQFLSGGLIFSQVDANGDRREHEAKSGGGAAEMPLVVLVNQFSASASEIMAGALKDHNRATIVGVTTFGKGSVNIQQPLSNGGGVLFTVANWFTPNGTLIEGQGIKPDVEIASDFSNMDDDVQLNKATEILREKIASS